MSIQWTFIAGFLYLEITVVVFMILPIFSPKKWHKFFRSELFVRIQQHASTYFYVILGVLVMFLIDSIREMRKYSTVDASYVYLTNEMKGNIKMFRAQRNFYITGFAIFLSFVIRRLISMLIIQHELKLKAEKIIKEAKSTVKLAKSTVLASDEDVKNFEQVKIKLAEMESLLEIEKIRVKELEEEATKWRLKYEEIGTQSNGQGDE